MKTPSRRATPGSMFTKENSVSFNGLEMASCVEWFISAPPQQLLHRNRPLELLATPI